MTPSISSRRCFFTLLCLLLLLGASPGRAANVTWSGPNGSNWSTGGSWLSGTAPANDTITDTAVFTSSGTANVDGTPRSVKSLDIQDNFVFTGSSQRLNLTGGVGNTFLTVTGGKTVTFYNSVSVASAGPSAYINNGATLNYYGQSPNGGTHNLTNATVNLYSDQYSYGSNNPSFIGSGTINYLSTATGTISGLRYAFDGTRFVIKSTANQPVAFNNAGLNGLNFVGSSQLGLERNFDMSLVGGASISGLAGTLEVGFISRGGGQSTTKSSTLTVDGAYTIKFNQLMFDKANDQTLVLDRSTVVIGSGTGVLGVFVGDSNNAGTVDNSARVFTITGTTASSGTLRVLAGATSSMNSSGTSATGNYGAELRIGANANLVNNGSWTNKNYSNNTTYVGLRVAAGATLSGTGSFDMSATAAGANSAKTTIVSGIMAPGDGSIGTLTIKTKSLTWNYNDGSAWKFELGLGATADKLSIDGDFLKGTSNDAGGKFAFDLLGTGTTGTFTLMDWTGSTTFSATDFSLTNLASGYNGTFSIDNKQLLLMVVPEPNSFAMLLSGFGMLLVAQRVRGRRFK